MYANIGPKKVVWLAEPKLKYIFYLGFFLTPLKSKLIKLNAFLFPFATSSLGFYDQYCDFWLLPENISENVPKIAMKKKVKIMFSQH